MSDQAEPVRAGREELLSVLNTAGTLAGLCVTVVVFMNSFKKANTGATIVDDMFSVGAVLFLSCIYLGFWGLRTKSKHLASILLRITDGLFIFALTEMVFAAVAMVYTIW